MIVGERECARVHQSMPERIFSPVRTRTHTTHTHAVSATHSHAHYARTRMQVVSFTCRMHITYDIMISYVLGALGRQRCPTSQRCPTREICGSQAMRPCGVKHV